MEEETGAVELETTGMRVPTERAASEDPGASEERRGPTWRGWVLSILVAIILSVTATLLLGGSSSFRSDRSVAGAGGCGAGAGAGKSCCPPADAEK